MKEERITLSYESIAERMFTESGYIARAREASGLPDKASLSATATEDDRRLIETLISASINECTNTLSHYLAPCRYSADEAMKRYDIDIKLPGNYPLNNLSALENIIMDYIVCRSLHNWYLMTRPEEAGVLATRLQPIQAKMREVLAMRNKPGE